MAAILRSGEAFIKALANASSVTIAERAERPEECAVAVLGDAEILLPLEGLIDREAETAQSQEGPVRHRQAARLDPRQARQRGIRLAAPSPRSSSQQRAKEAELAAQRESVLKLLGEA